jgi:hypothetical protein
LVIVCATFVMSVALKAVNVAIVTSRGVFERNGAD